MTDKKLTEIFSRFAGQEVQVTEMQREYTSRRTKETYKFTEANLDDNDPVIAELNKVAQDQGLSTRIFTPGTAGTADWQPRRLNVHVAKEQDGKYRIQPDFHLG